MLFLLPVMLETHIHLTAFLNVLFGKQGAVWTVKHEQGLILKMVLVSGKFPFT